MGPTSRASLLVKTTFFIVQDHFIYPCASRYHHHHLLLVSSRETNHPLCAATTFRGRVLILKPILYPRQVCFYRLIRNLSVVVHASTLNRSSTLANSLYLVLHPPPLGSSRVREERGRVCSPTPTYMICFRCHTPIIHFCSTEIYI